MSQGLGRESVGLDPGLGDGQGPQGVRQLHAHTMGLKDLVGLEPEVPRLLEHRGAFPVRGQGHGEGLYAVAGVPVRELSEDLSFFIVDAGGATPFPYVPSLQYIPVIFIPCSLHVA